jgi:hypothetical protein
MIKNIKLRTTHIKILFIISALLIVVSILNNYVKFKKLKYNTLKIDNAILKNGDLVLRCGRSTESYAVYLADNNPKFTHIGIICFENGNPYVIHAVPHKNKFIKKEPLQQFLNTKYTSQFAIYRTNFSSDILNNVAKEAQIFYNKKYIFDNEYDLTSNTKLYCTELILKAFQNTGIYLNIQCKPFKYVVGEHPIIFPSEFTKKPEFNRII